MDLWSCAFDRLSQYMHAGDVTLNNIVIIAAILMHF